MRAWRDGRWELWWGNPEIPTTVHRVTVPGGGTFFVKTAPSLRREYDRLTWCQGRIPVPEVVSFSSSEEGDELVTVAIEGNGAHLCRSEGAVAARGLAEAWRMVHAVDIDTCPFDFSTHSLLEDVARRVPLAPNLRIWDDARAEDRPAGDVYAELDGSRPLPSSNVLVHGDASVPNVLLRDGRLVGIVDVGMLGVGDAWWDLATCLGSMSREDNGLAAYRENFLSAYGVEYDPERDRWFRLLYRLIFDLPGGLARG